MNENALQIKLATTEDIDDLIATYEEARLYKHSLNDEAWGSNPFTRNEIIELITQNNLYVVKSGNQQVGAFTLTWRDTLNWNEAGDDSKAGYLHLLAIRDAFRGRKFGEQIISWCAQHIKHQGRTHIRLDAPSKNRKLCEYYENQGFKIVRKKNDDTYPAALYEKPV